MSGSEEDRWVAVGGGACADWLRDRLTQPGLADMTAAELATAADCDPTEAHEVLDRAVAAGLLTMMPRSHRVEF